MIFLENLLFICVGMNQQIKICPLSNTLKSEIQKSAENKRLISLVPVFVSRISYSLYNFSILQFVDLSSFCFLIVFCVFLASQSQVSLQYSIFSGSVKPSKLIVSYISYLGFYLYLVSFVVILILPIFLMILIYLQSSFWTTGM